MANTFREYYDKEVSPDEKIQIEFEGTFLTALVKSTLAGELTEQKAVWLSKQDSSAMTVEQLQKILVPLGYKVAIVPIDTEVDDDPPSY